MNVFDPTRGFNAFAQGAQIGGSIRQAQTNSKLAPMVAAGNYKGAADYAGQRGDLGGAERYGAQYAEQQKTQLSEEQERRRRGALQAAMEMMATPEGQRTPEMAASLLGKYGVDGIDPSGITDLSDTGITKFASAMQDTDFLQKQFEEMQKTQVVAGGAQVWRNGQMIGENARDPKPPATGMVQDENGNWVYSPEYLAGQERMRAAGRSQTNVYTGDVGAGDRPIVDKPPKGYQRVWDPQSKTYRDMPIPGSEADISMEDDAMSAFQKLQTSTFTNDLINSEIDRAVENTNQWSTGWGNMLLKDLPQTQARALNNAVTMIQANLSFDRLQQMRDESKTGGALGAVSEREIDLLQSTVQKLDTMTDPKELVRALETVRTQLNKIQNLRKQIYAQKYGGYVAGDGSGMITPTDSADLPPGFEVVQ